MSSEPREARAANLLDLRRIIGGVFTIWGVLLVILGMTASDAEIQKAAGININLWAGLGMLAVGLGFLAWGVTRPLGEQRSPAQSEDAEELTITRLPSGMKPVGRHATPSPERASAAST